jgi:hypothetical protein
MPSARPLDIFIVAEQFRYAGKFAILVTTHMAPKYPELTFAGNLNNVTAAMVCSAFSLELYFKCLIRMGHKSFGWEHDLERLFAGIGRRNRAKIKRYWNANSDRVRSYIKRTFEDDGLTPPRIDFDYVLSASKDAFVTMRYVYERGIETNKGWLADTIVEGARATILSIHPEWENARQKEPRPETSFGQA